MVLKPLPKNLCMLDYGTKFDLKRRNLTYKIESLPLVYLGFCIEITRSQYIRKRSIFFPKLDSFFDSTDEEEQKKSSSFGKIKN
jgi:hypothetical protein